MLQQKSGSFGLQNTAYFHASIKDRTHKNLIKIKLSDGSWCTDSPQIGDMAVRSFDNLFSSIPHTVDEELFHGFPAGINDADNAFLQQVPTEFGRLSRV